jgi:hypothetical protein
MRVHQVNLPAGNLVVHGSRQRDVRAIVRFDESDLQRRKITREEFHLAHARTKQGQLHASQLLHQKRIDVLKMRADAPYRPADHKKYSQSAHFLVIATVPTPLRQVVARFAEAQAPAFQGAGAPAFPRAEYAESAFPANPERRPWASRRATLTPVPAKN